MEEHRRVGVSGERLFRQMKLLGFSAAEVSRRAGARGKKIAPRTISRALAGHSIELGKLKTICDVLEQPLSRFLASESDRLSQSAQDERFIGKWHARFVEMRLSKGMRVVNEINEVYLEDGKLQADFMPATDQETELETVKWIKSVGNNLVGESWVDDWDAPVGIGMFHLTLCRGDNLLDGVTSWADPDTGLVEWSRYVWIRDDCKDEAVVSRAKELVEEERQHYNARMKMRLGLF